MTLSQLIKPVPATRYYELLEWYGVFTLSYLRALYLDAGMGADADNIETAIQAAESYCNATFHVEMNEEHIRHQMMLLRKNGRSRESINYLISDTCQLIQCEKLIAELYA